jgi:hypothetical protein
MRTGFLRYDQSVLLDVRRRLLVLTVTWWSGHGGESARAVRVLRPGGRLAIADPLSTAVKVL